MKVRSLPPQHEGVELAKTYNAWGAFRLAYFGHVCHFHYKVEDQCLYSSYSLKYRDKAKMKYTRPCLLRVIGT